MRPLKIKSSAVPASSANFQGLQEMTDAEMQKYISAVITKKFADDTDGTGTAELNLDTANALAGTSIGTFSDTTRTEAIGTHPAGGSVNVTTYYAKQITATASGSVTNRPMGWDTTLSGIKEFTDAEINTDILDTVISDMVSSSDYTVGQYALSTSAPTGGTWTQRYTITNTFASGGSTNTIGIWQKTAPTTSADTNLYPIKSYNTTNLRGETQAEVEEMVPAFRNRIISEGVGTYKLQTATPSGGTWVKQGDAGGFTDTRQVVSPSDYSGTYTSAYTGEYTGVFVGPVSYTGTYTEPYTGTYVGPVNYAGSYTDSFTGVFVGPVNYTGAYTGTFSGAYTGVFVGPVTYTGSYTRAWTGAYAGSYLGTADFSYTGSYAGSYILYYGGFVNSAWTGAYTGAYVGPGPQYYTGTYSGAYNQAYSGTFVGPVNYTGVYTGAFDQTFTGVFVGPVNYTGTYTGAFAGTYVGPVNFSGTYSEVYAGAYVGPVNYTGVYSGTFSPSYTGIYASDTVQVSTENVSTVYLWLRTA